jgi:hypothetical protein
MQPVAMLADDTQNTAAIAKQLLAAEEEDEKEEKGGAPRQPLNSTVTILGAVCPVLCASADQLGAASARRLFRPPVQLLLGSLWG